MKTVIHVNQHIIRSNKTRGENLPPITVKTYKSNEYTDRVEILGDDDEVIATVCYRPEDPLACGATVWIETRNKVIVRQ